MSDCLEKSTGFSSEEGADEFDFAPSPEKVRRTGKDPRRGEEIEQCLFVCDSSQIALFVDDINSSSKCSTAKCNSESTNYAHSVVALTQISAYITQKKSVVRKSVQALRTVYAKYLRFVERNV